MCLYFWGKASEYLKASLQQCYVSKASIISSIVSMKKPKPTKPSSLRGLLCFINPKERSGNTWEDDKLWTVTGSHIKHELIACSFSYPTYTDSACQDLREPAKIPQWTEKGSGGPTPIWRSTGNWWLAAVSCLQGFRALRWWSHTHAHTDRTKCIQLGRWAECRRGGRVSVQARKLGGNSGSREKRKGIQGKGMGVDLIRINDI